jgi:hypothetical protein
LGYNAIPESVSQSFDFCLRKGSGNATIANDVVHSWHLENLRTLCRREPNEHVAGKQRQLNLVPSVLPTVRCLVERKKTLDTAVVELSYYRFFVARANVRREPLWYAITRVQTRQSKWR